MENNKGAIIFNGSDVSPHLKSIIFKYGIFISSLLIGYFLEGKFHTTNNFYKIMAKRINFIAPWLSMIIVYTIEKYGSVRSVEEDDDEGDIIDWIEWLFESGG